MTNATKFSATMHGLLKRLPLILVRIKRYIPLPLDPVEFTHVSQERETKKKSKKKQKNSKRDGGSYPKISWALILVILYS